MSWVFVSKCMVSASDVCWVVISDVVTMTPFSGSNCGCIAQHAIERQTRFRQGELRDAFFMTRLSS